jgi:O-antigen/teichoic acid export membrane protein
VIRVMLGERWTAVIVPFQILGLGMLFRTSYKMSDSIARSTGVVYRRAWRQILYAALVVVAAWIGQRWGVAGVSWGALAALTVNFFLMAELSLDVSAITWQEFWEAHRPAVLLTLCSFPVVYGATALVRGLEFPALLVILTVGLLQLVVCVGLIRQFPKSFLGRDGQWMLETLQGYIRKRSPAIPLAASEGRAHP